MKVGFIGLGPHGLSNGNELLKAGHDLTIYNRTAREAKRFSSKAPKLPPTQLKLPRSGFSQNQHRAIGGRTTLVAKIRKLCGAAKVARPPDHPFGPAPSARAAISLRNPAGLGVHFVQPSGQDCVGWHS
jgi:hypothetical protein